MLDQSRNKIEQCASDRKMAETLDTWYFLQVQNRVRKNSAFHSNLIFLGNLLNVLLTEP